MGSQHIKGPTIPGPGDDILASIDTMVSTSGLIREVASPDAARGIITQAIAAGKGPTSANPMFFSFAGTLARATGELKSGRPVLTPAVTADAASAQSTKSGVITLNGGSYAILCKAELPVRPYDRAVLATGHLWGKNADSSVVDFEVWVNGAKGRGRLGRWDDMTTASCVGTIPANTAPDVSMWLLGAGSKSTVTVSADEWSKLSVIAFPAPQF